MAGPGSRAHLGGKDEREGPTLLQSYEGILSGRGEGGRPSGSGRKADAGVGHQENGALR